MKNKIFSLFFLVLIVSCALESKFGLPNDEKINTELIGTWLDIKTNETLLIKKNNEMSYKLIPNDSTEIIFYSKKIKGFNVLNIVTNDNGVKTNSFFGFELRNDTLEFSEVNKDLKETDFNSQAELIKFFNENIDKKGFFINPTIVIRE
ncbi:hypothetical protein HSX10_09040 [Winogradskyella undariae]|uniref:hypothetical protein n=1 Tax=Winogradskyella undariae TaxID=1285465 RepID=UPI00156AAEFF|nr:hypothetical protein [Winogradskyella undariae]NRR91706.1 hypothetical protein [Winogradskyella undariae]QNK76132.1 hypothetical protein H7F37_08180 [Winogradskyella sp. PAMC22761]